MTTVQIKNELKEVRFYYANKDMFERAEKITPAVATLSIVNKYNNAIKQAPSLLYLLYMSLYVYNNSQVTLSDDWDICVEKICEHNKNLIRFFQNSLSE